MRIVYADPPYLGCCSMYDHFHNDGGSMPWDGKCWNKLDTHAMLIDWLQQFDGWLYACNLGDLAHFGLAGRVGVWTKTFHQIRGIATQYATEGVIFKESRSFNRKPMVRDYLSCRMAFRTDFRGAKPDQYNDWVLDLVTYETGDEFIDLFPGSHSMDRARACRDALN